MWLLSVRPNVNNQAVSPCSHKDARRTRRPVGGHLRELGGCHGQARGDIRGRQVRAVCTAHGSRARRAKQEDIYSDENYVDLRGAAGQDDIYESVVNVRKRLQ